MSEPHRNIGELMRDHEPGGILGPGPDVHERLVEQVPRRLDPADLAVGHGHGAPEPQVVGPRGEDLLQQRHELAKPALLGTNVGQFRAL